ncbi:MAG: proteasome-activating nucleotidase [Methanosarcinales archaeon Met12]|nr:MAG: proteasome-activating nucleotidase [Methanosarcinales archaeon Met12]
MVAPSTNGTHNMNSDDFLKYSLDKIRQLEERNSILRGEYHQMEYEKRSIEAEKQKYEQEIRKLRSELERLKTLPLIIGTVLDVLETGKVVIKSSTGPQFVVNASQFIDGLYLQPGARVALNQQTLAVIGVLPSPKDPLVGSMEIIESPSVDYEDIGGLMEQINELRETVELPLTKPEIFAKVGIEPPSGVLLHGPPGSGKTMLGKAVARRTNATFIKVVGSELVQKYIGEGARLVRELFKMAREKAPSIIFVDELDAIGARRIESATSGDREVQRTLMQLLAEMDGFDARGDVKILAATNRIDILDPALLRHGRFDRVVEVPLPDFKTRVEIFKIHSRDMSLADEIDFEYLASVTSGTSGADIKAITMEAGMFAIRDERDSITVADFDSAVKKVMTSAQRTEASLDSGMMFA